MLKSDINNKNTKPELLAPAGSPKAFFAAVNNGADAVYLGLNIFNARAKAENFTLDNLGFYINYAHLLNVKVYLALNTLIKDSEFDTLQNIVKSVADLKIDAFIVQDLGVFFLIKSLLPDFDVHASTQMGVCNLGGAKFCEKLGFKRIILARETSLDEIEHITKNCGIEIEVFVHGALCVSMSGQCYLSSSIFSESGNRGKCLQPCRKFYSVLKNDKEISKGYMLSPSDLCLAECIETLKPLGISAFKIEGRMRRCEYVAEAVKLYRKLIDEKNFNIDLNPVKKLYNRGDYTLGYMFDDKNLMNKDVQGHKGLYIGNVIEITDGDKLLINSNQALQKGDGFKIFSQKNLETGNGIFANHIKNGIYALNYKGNVKTGDKVHITTDSKEIENINTVKKNIGISADFTAKLNGYAKLRLVYGDIIAETVLEEKLSKAENKPVDYSTVYEILNKIKETPFIINNFKFDADNVFIPLSKLNVLKKAAFLNLENKILEKFDYIKKHGFKDLNIVFEKNKVKLLNIAIVDKNPVKTDYFDYIIFKPKDYTISNVNSFLTDYKDFKSKYLFIPPYISNDDINLIYKMAAGFDGFYINNPGGLDSGFVKDKGIIIGEGFNVFNRYALKLIEQFNVKAVVVSKELNVKEIESIAESSKVPVIALVYGETEAMQLKHCIVKNIYNGNCSDCKYSDDLYYKDAKEKFKIFRRRINGCYFVLNNSKKLNALKNLKAGKFGFAFDFSYDNTEEIKNIQKFYEDKFINNLNPEFDFLNYTNGFKGV